MFQYPEYISKVSPSEYQYSRTVFEANSIFTIGQQILESPNLNFFPNRVINSGKSENPGFWRALLTFVFQIIPAGDVGSENYMALNFGTYMNPNSTVQVKVLNQQTTFFYVNLRGDFVPQVTETKYYSFLDLLLDIGAFKAVLEIIAYILVSAYAYKSYSTYVSRQIQKE